MLLNIINFQYTMKPRGLIALKINFIKPHERKIRVSELKKEMFQLGILNHTKVKDKLNDKKKIQTLILCILSYSILKFIFFLSFNLSLILIWPRKVNYGPAIIMKRES